MPRAYNVSTEQSKQLFEQMRGTTDLFAYRRLQAVALRGSGRKSAEIAVITGFNSDYITVLVKKYLTNGIDSLMEDNRGGRRHMNLSEKEEQEFLAEFLEKAKRGQVVDVGEIAKAYDKLTGKERTSKSTIYGLLHRHGWRMVMPRGQHPNKASEEEIEASKKLT